MTTALPKVDYPVAEIIAGTGFFFFNFLQYFVNYIKRRSEPQIVVHEASIGVEVTEVETKDGTINPACEYLESTNFDGEDMKTNDNTDPVEIAIIDEPSVDIIRVDSTADLHNQSMSTETKSVNSDVASCDTPEVTTAAGSRSIILLIALCFDGFFQGMAIGLQRSNMAVLSVLLGIVSHEFAIAFTLGLELIVTHSKKMHIISALVYGGTPAVGVIVGLSIYVTSQGDNPEDGYLVNGILQSLATGTFLYVIVVGILGRELQNPCIQALLTCLLGYTFLASLAIYHPQYGYGSDKGEDSDQSTLSGNFIPLYQMRFRQKYS